jgi:hypothetical protein
MTAGDPFMAITSPGSMPALRCGRAEARSVMRPLEVLVLSCYDPGKAAFICNFLYALDQYSEHQYNYLF